MVSSFMAIYRLIKRWQLSVLSRIFLNQTRPNNFLRRYQNCCLFECIKLFVRIHMHATYCLGLLSVNKFLEYFYIQQNFTNKLNWWKQRKEENLWKEFSSPCFNWGLFVFYSLHYLHIKQCEDGIIKQWVNSQLWCKLKDNTEKNRDFIEQFLLIEDHETESKWLTSKTIHKNKL